MGYPVIGIAAYRMVLIDVPGISFVKAFDIIGAGRDLADGIICIPGHNLGTDVLGVFARSAPEGNDIKDLAFGDQCPVGIIEGPGNAAVQIELEIDSRKRISLTVSVPRPIF